jgi:hypothetical protein
MLQKLIRTEELIEQKYKDMEVKCTTISLLYSSFLFEVSRDVRKANGIL